MYLVCRAAGFRPLVSVIAPVVMILAVPCFMTGGGYFYDYPELAFMALAVWIALRLDWWWLLPVAALATWNKESFLFMLPTLYPLLRQRTSRIRAAVAVGLLMVTSGAVYMANRVHSAHNPGATVLLKWKSQIKFVLKPAHWVNWEVTYGFAHFKAFSLIPLALLVWTVWRGWLLLPPAIQRHGQIAAALHLPLFFSFACRESCVTSACSMLYFCCCWPRT